MGLNIEGLHRVLICLVLILWGLVLVMLSVWVLEVLVLIPT